MKTAEYIQNNRPALFDWFVITICFSLSFVFPKLGDIAFTRFFSGYMLSGLVLYVIGVCLKRLPLYERMLRNGEHERQIPYVFFLAIGHWIIIYTVYLLSANALGRVLGIKIAQQNESTSGIYYLIGFILSLLITWLVFHKMKLPDRTKIRSERHLFYRELFADILLLLSVSAFTFIFWEKGIMTLFLKGLPTRVSDVFFQFFLLSICFVLFYLPLRYLFLVEDHTSRQTWQRLLLIFGFLLLRSLMVLLHYF